MKRSLILSLFSFLFASCSINSDVYTNEKDTLNFQDFLQDSLIGWGIFEDRGGQVIKRFRIDMEADWKGNHCRFIENFSFSDGTKQRREWQITQIDKSHFEAVANDSVGIGKGTVFGNSVHWEYHIAIDTESFGKQTVKFDYWMHKIDDDTLMNRANVTKLGIKMGEVSVVFRKAKAIP